MGLNVTYDPVGYWPMTEWYISIFSSEPNHYLNQCWLVIGEVLRHSPQGSFTGNAQDNYPWYEFEKYLYTSPRGQWVNQSASEQQHSGSLIQSEKQISSWVKLWKDVSIKFLKVSVKFLNSLFFAYKKYLTHLAPVPHICINELGQHWFR